MIYSLPIRFDIPIQNTSGQYPNRFPQTNGYDNNGVRVTNLVGYENGDFLKICPNCGRTLPSEAFGLRITENRDQSWCSDCR